ncbi:hypothetical protein [Sphingobacterium psychroaquaticum]|uniref:hypothetical protein n=1 Tax=Sphingobacterium psychroaquaticum TaxID=561061 RepID=UPI001F0E5842|nr:hypothetical protein [Sphingobacterium psychroaquaticum]
MSELKLKQLIKTLKKMNRYLRNWNLMRVLRLALGIFIIVQGIMEQQWLLVGMGSLFSLMPLMNIGCCGVSGCNTPVRKSNKKLEDILYEEVR